MCPVYWAILPAQAETSRTQATLHPFYAAWDASSPSDGSPGKAAIAVLVGWGSLDGPGLSHFQVPTVLTTRFPVPHPEPAPCL